MDKSLKNSKISNFIKIRPVEVELFHDEDNSRFSQICEHAYTLRKVQHVDLKRVPYATLSNQLLCVSCSRMWPLFSIAQTRCTTVISQISDTAICKHAIEMSLQFCVNEWRFVLTFVLLCCAVLPAYNERDFIFY
jgi:hypothetical protein